MHILIIGTGSIGQRHLRNALRIEEVRCSVAEMDAATREKVASEHALQGVYADYREADLASFDGVVIAVPAHLHIPIALQAIQGFPDGCSGRLNTLGDFTFTEAISG